MSPIIKKLLALGLLCFVAGGGYATLARANRPLASAALNSSPPPATSPRLAIYFVRAQVGCASCRKVKAWTLAGLQKLSKKPHLVTQTIFYDRPGADKLIKKFGIYTQSVILVEEDAGGIRRWKNLDRVWELLLDHAAFERYLQTEIVAFAKAKK